MMGDAGKAAENNAKKAEWQHHLKFTPPYFSKRCIAGSAQQFTFWLKDNFFQKVEKY